MRTKYSMAPLALGFFALAGLPETPSALPQTGSSAPRFAAAGLALALSGVLLSRKVL